MGYWGALLWRQLMGPTVLDSSVPVELGLHVYAHCQRHVSGGVTLLVLYALLGDKPKKQPAA